MLGLNGMLGMLQDTWILRALVCASGVGKGGGGLVRVALLGKGP